MANPLPKTINAYIAAAPKEARAKLRELRALLKSVAPKATEAIKWRVPVFIGKRILFGFAAFRKHMTFGPTHSALVPFKKELSKFTTGKDTIQFPYDKPLPKALIRKIAAYRTKQVEHHGALWMSR